MLNSEFKVDIGANQFKWDQDKGLLTFDGAPALIFWDSAIELFLSTLEEVSGSDVSKTVYEATGYRMGHLVSSYYEGRNDIEQVLTDYRDIYKNAGWGDFQIEQLSLEERKVVVRLTDNWEHRIFRDSRYPHAKVLLPAHWAGIFGGLFKQDMWYKKLQCEQEGHGCDVIELYPSTITAAKNIHELSRRKEQQSIAELEQKVQDRTEELSSLVKELSSPVIPVLKGILVIPLIGKYNDERISDLIERALIELAGHKANYLLIDVTGMTNVDEYTIEGVQKLAKAVRLLGGQCCIVGVSAEMSMRITGSRVNMAGIQTFSNLQQGVEYAISQGGYELVKRK